VAVVDGGEIAWAQGYGVRTAGSGAPVTTATLFQAASISKPVAALAALRLAEQGVLDLDRPVNQQLRTWHLPASMAGSPDEVTPRLLMTHGAGLSVHGFPGYPHDAPLPGIRRILDGITPANTEAVRLIQAPGAGWRYSGGGYTVLQLLLEDVTGEDFAALAERLVLRPLGMRDSTYRQPLPRRLGRRAARAHDGSGQPVPGGWHVYPEQAAAGLWTTPTDLARFAVAIQQTWGGAPDAILGPALSRRLLAPHVGAWGLGLSLAADAGALVFGHGGSNEGFRCTMFAYADRGQGAVVMTNGERGGQLAEEVLRAIADEYGWPDHRPVTKTAVELAPAVLATLVGRFTIDGRSTAQVMLDEGVLVLESRSLGRQKLFAESSETLFTLENLEIRLERNEEGRVTALFGSQAGREWKAEREL